MATDLSRARGPKRSRHGRALFLALGAAIASADEAVGATRTWDRGGGSNLWSGISNWSGDMEPTSADPVIFPSVIPPGTLSISCTATENALDLTFNNNYSIGANFLQLHGVGGPINVASGFSATISSALTGSVGITKTGGGTLFLTGNNAFTGGLNINGGTVSVDATASFGNAANAISITSATLTNTVSLTNSRTINIGIVNAVINQNLFWTQNGALGASANPLQILGTGSFALNATSTRTGRM